MTPRLNARLAASLFQPDLVAQTILDTESYGTPVMDLFFPEARRRTWDRGPYVPIDEIENITRAVPLVYRGAPGLSIKPQKRDVQIIEPQPTKTYDTLDAAEFQNWQFWGRASQEQWQQEKVQRHLSTHRNSAESLCAQALSGTISYPIADQTGNVIDDYTVAFGNVQSYTVQNDWTAGATTIAQIHRDLVGMSLVLQRAGYNGDRVIVGANIFDAILGKVETMSNDQRIPARLQDDGAIRIGRFSLMPFDYKYYHPGNAAGTITAGYKDVIGGDTVMMWDSNAPWTFLRLLVDNFKSQALPLAVIAEVAQDGSAIDVYAESKCLPIPPRLAILQTDATATA